MVRLYFIALSLFWLISGDTIGQFADQSYYLIDSLKLNALSENDRYILDSALTLYHKATHDTDKIIAVNIIAEECWDDRLWLRYNGWVYDYIEGHLANRPSDTTNKFYLIAKANALNNFGYFYKYRGEFVKASAYYNASINIQEKIGDTEGLANTLNNLGAIYDNIGAVEKSFEYYDRSLIINTEYGYNSGIATNLNNIGGLHEDQGNIEEALEYYFKSLSIDEKIKNRQEQAITLNNIGVIYYKTGDFSKAMEYSRKSLNIREETGDKLGVSQCLNNIGFYYDKIGDNAKALEYCIRSLKIREDIGAKSATAISLYNIGSFYLDNDELTNSMNYANRCMTLSNQLGYPKLIGSAASLLNRIAKKSGNFKEALAMWELHIQMRDSIKNKTNQKAAIRQQTKYEFEKAQLVKEQEEIETTRIEAEVTARRDNLQYSVILIAILVLLGGVLSLGFMKVSTRMAEGITFFSFLILFEFFLVLADPYIDDWSGGAPGFKLLFNAGIAALIFPMHAFFEAKLKRRLAK